MKNDLANLNQASKPDYSGFLCETPNDEHGNFKPIPQNSKPLIMKPKSFYNVICNLKGYFLVTLFFLLVAGMGNLGVAQTATPTATIMTDQKDYSPGETVTITGANWQPNETVDLLIEHVFYSMHPDQLIKVTADASGNIYDNTYIVKEEDLGEVFILTATGQNSGFTADWNFTDGPNITSISVSLQSGSICPDNSGTVNYTVTVGKKNSSVSPNASLCLQNLPAWITCRSLDFV